MNPPTITSIEVNVVFLAESEGGRKSLPTLLGRYRPHIVVFDKSATFGRQDVYLGIEFQNGPENFNTGQQIKATAILLWYPHPAYDLLKPGTTFEVREGPKKVGYGSVLRRL